MRVKITLEPTDGRLTLPVHYNHVVQGFIYHQLGQSLATEVHDRGYQFEKRSFRFFNFSRLLGETRISPNDAQVREYRGPVTLWVASPLTKILESFVSHLARAGQAMLGNNDVRITAVEVPFQDANGANRAIRVRTLSPITVYSTLLTGDGRKKTYYYSPQEPEFSQQIGANLAKKRIALKESVEFRVSSSESSHSSLATPDSSLVLRPIRVSTRDQHVVYYRDTVVKAWSGIYELTGDSELIRLAFDAGLGAKNSQGFGMIERM